jgi:hypothetical protein
MQGKPKERAPQQKPKDANDETMQNQTKKDAPQLLENGESNRN